MTMVWGSGSPRPLPLPPRLSTCGAAKVHKVIFLGGASLEEPFTSLIFFFLFDLTEGATRPLQKKT